MVVEFIKAPFDEFKRAINAAAITPGKWLKFTRAGLSLPSYEYTTAGVWLVYSARTGCVSVVRECDPAPSYEAIVEVVKEFSKKDKDHERP